MSLANAAKIDVWNIPSPTLVVEIESIPNCKGCPAYRFLQYSNGTSHFEGKDAVFGLGIQSSYERMERFRNADPKSNLGVENAENSRLHYLQRHHHSEMPTWLTERLKNIAKLGFFAHKQSSEQSDISKTRARIRMSISWNGQNQSIVAPDNAMPLVLRDSIAEVFRQSEISIAEAPAFWADSDAVLWITEAGYHLRCGSQTGLILYRNGRVTLFGWNRFSTDKGFMTITSSFDKSRLLEIFRGFESGKVDIPRQAYSPYAGDRYWSIEVDRGLNTVIHHVVVYKPKPNALTHIPESALVGLSKIWEEMRDKMPRNDPKAIDYCAKNPVR